VIQSEKQIGQLESNLDETMQKLTMAEKRVKALEFERVHLKGLLDVEIQSKKELELRLEIVADQLKEQKTTWQSIML
jgi:hypothetical protein